MNLESGVLQVHIEDIIPNRFQPRLTFDEQGLKELADSIREHGIIQPLVLRKLGDKYEIIAGERRYKAAQIAGLPTVPAVIANIDDNKSAEVALVENVQRRDLTAIEEARSYKNLLDKDYLTQEQLAKRMGLSQPAIANKLRLLNLDDEVQQALLDEKISERHARTLLTLQDKNAQKEWLHRIINERLTVRQLDLELRKYKENMEDEEIPLVSSNRSIEEIKANAMDIGLANKMNNAQNLNEDKDNNETLETLDTSTEQSETLDMMPSSAESIDQSAPTPFATFNPAEQPINNSAFTTATTVPEFNIATPNSASTFIPNDNLNFSPIEENKFFNINSTPSDFMPNQFNDNQSININSTPTLENQQVNNSNNFEIFDASTPTIDNSFIANSIASAPVPEESSEPAPALSPFDNSIYDNNAVNINPNNKFFTPIATMPQDINIVNKETEINPMDNVANLTTGFQNPQIVQKEEGLKTAISSIRSCIEDLGSKGFLIDVEEIDLSQTYQITVQIHKDN